MLLVMIYTLSTGKVPERHALIIAIGNYPDPLKNGWKPISSIRDATVLTSALLRQDFKAANIDVVTDKQATADGITLALEKLGQRVDPGDVVVIHVSAHGAQVQDEYPYDEPDFLDECIVTYNAKHDLSPDGNEHIKATQAAEELKNYYRDDLLGAKIDALRVKLGTKGDLLVLLDNCHSGSGTRGWTSNKIRGGEPPIIFSDFETVKKTVNTNAVSGNELIMERSVNDDQTRSTCVVISGARSYEINYETEDDSGKNIGTLTYAVCASLQQLQPNTTYRAFFTRLASIIMERKGNTQHPVIEGYGMDRELFGGNMVVQQPYFEALLSTKEIQINGGCLQGLYPGTKVALYKAGSLQPDGASLIATAEVTASDNFSSTAKIRTRKREHTSGLVWAFVTEKAFAKDTLTLAFGAGYTSPETESIKRGLANYPLVRFRGKPELMLVKGAGMDSLFLVSGESFLTCIQKPYPDNQPLRDALERYSHYRLLQSLYEQDEEVRVSARIVPVIAKAMDTTDYRKLYKPGRGYTIPSGTKIKVWLQNNSDTAVYINILDLQPDGKVNPIFPIHTQDLTIQAEDMRLEPGQGRFYPAGMNEYIEIGPPFGLERFKVFAIMDDGGAAPDLERIATSRGQTTSRGASDNVLENLLQSTYLHSRGEPHRPFTTGGHYSIFDIVFEIVDGRIPLKL